MTRYRCAVHIVPRRGILDPQGEAVGSALGHLGFDGVTDVRQGRYIVLDLAETDRARAEAAVKAMLPAALSKALPVLLVVALRVRWLPNLATTARRLPTLRSWSLPIFQPWRSQSSAAI